MASFERVRLDSKGRLLVPQVFRESLRLKEGAEVSLVLDEKSGHIILASSDEKGLMFITIEFSDAPGALANAAEVLARNQVDLISTESRSIQRGKKAEWRILCNVSAVKDLNGLKKELLRASASSVKFTKPS
ncbi:MAG: hypothetical protein V1708_00495 [Candidatus Micrarchaeota archaeon]